MQVDTKLFTLDKNYLLREAQLQLKSQLLKELVAKVKNTYLNDHNPLGLMDDVIYSIYHSKTCNIDCLDNFYKELSGIYRFKYGRNQLEFIFDGTPHIEKYKKDFIRQFRKWVREFCQCRHFLRAVLEGSILRQDLGNNHLIEIRLKYFLEQYFGLRVYKYRGIRKIQVA